MFSTPNCCINMRCGETYDLDWKKTKEYILPRSMMHQPALQLLLIYLIINILHSPKLKPHWLSILFLYFSINMKVSGTNIEIQVFSSVSIKPITHVSVAYRKNRMLNLVLNIDFCNISPSIYRKYGLLN